MSGWVCAILSSVLAAPRGERLPCSQFWTASIETSSSSANCRWVRFADFLAKNRQELLFSVDPTLLAFLHLLDCFEQFGTFVTHFGFASHTQLPP